MMDRPRSDPGASSALGKLAGFVIAVVVLAGIYVGYQALQVLFPPNTYETALLATVADTVDADGVLLFDEVYVPGGGTLGYLAADGERVSAGAAVALSRGRRRARLGGGCGSGDLQQPGTGGPPPAAHQPERPDRASAALSEYHRHPAGFPEKRAGFRAL